MRLLIAEDELDLAEALTVFFEKNHFSVDAVHKTASMPMNTPRRASMTLSS